MITVSAGLRHHVDLRAARGPALGGIDSGAHAKLGDGVQRNVQARVGLLRLFLHTAGVDAVERKIAVVEGVPVEADAALRAVAVVDCPGDQGHQAGPVAPADRNLLDLGRFDDAGDFRRASFQSRCRAQYLDRSVGCRHLQPGILCQRLANAQHPFVELCGAEPGVLDGQGVGADRKRRKEVNTLGIRLRGPVNGGPGCDRCDFGACYNSA